MASPAVCSVLLILAAFAAASARAATFTITNNCGYTARHGQSMCPPAPAAGSGAVPAAPSTEGAATATAPTVPALSCTVSGQPPATLAEYTIGGDQDYYNISVVNGYNLPMAFSCSTGVGLVCREPNCPDAYQYPTDDKKTHACSTNSNYQITFCP
ncbi:unnamed protein product [Urochloa decumbens]|uniref:Thaumatin-like protein n=1 Tax=Urochloa decumbens TaxID=240449 RepID=A0ABC8VH28_9POAL